jgi:hypothetical protein
MKRSGWLRLFLFCPALFVGLVVFMCFPQVASAKEAVPVFRLNGSENPGQGVPAAIEYTVQVSTIGSGGVSLDPPGGIYDGGTVVTLTTSPEAGWSFVGWSGDLVGAQTPLALTIDSNKTLTATFLQTQDKHDPFADTYTDDTNPDKAYGLDDYLFLRVDNGLVNTSGCTASTYIWLKFAIPYTVKNIPAVVLSIPSEPDSDDNSMDLELFGSPDISWDESSLTWDNQPNNGLELITAAIGAPPGSDTLFWGSGLENYVNAHKGELVSFLVKADCDGSVSETAERIVRALQHSQGSGVELYYDYPAAVSMVKFTARSDLNDDRWFASLGLFLVVALTCTAFQRASKR